MRSLGDAQTAVQRHLSAALWNWLVRPILMIPALPAFLVLGLIFLWLGRARRRRPTRRLRHRLRGRPGAGAAAASEPFS